MRKLFCLPICFALGLLPFLSFSQEVLLQGRIKELPANASLYLVLWSQQGKKDLPIDSVKLGTDGKFSFKKPANFQQGIYKVGLNGGYKTNLVCGPQALPILESSYSAFMKSGFLVQNTEMQAWAELEERKARFEQQMDSIQKNHELDEFDPQYRTKSDLMEKDIVQLKRKFNASIDEIKAQFPTTYIAEVLSNFYRFPVKESSSEMDKMFDTQVAFLHMHYFDYVDFKDIRYLNNNKWEDFIFQYLLRYVKLDLNGFKFGVNHVLGLAGTNQEVKDRMISYFMDLFAEKGPQEMLAYLADTYGSSCESLIKPQTQDMVKKIKLLAVGNLAPDFISPDINMQGKKLSENLGKKATLLLFWSSTCTHCQSEIPNLITQYAKYKALGFEVVAVSMDKDYSAWLKFIQEKKLVWLNLCEFKGWQSNVAQTYLVHKTPTAYLLDAQGTIIDKEFDIAGLGTKLEKLFK